MFDSVEDAMLYDHAGRPKTARPMGGFPEESRPGDALKRDLHYRNISKKALESGKSAPVPEFLWPMLANMAVPTFVIRGLDSNMFEASILKKVRLVSPRASAISIPGAMIWQEIIRLD